MPKYLADELESTQNRCLDIIGIPRTSLPTLEERRKVATKRELERIGNNKKHPNQIFTTEPNTSYSNTKVKKPKDMRTLYGTSSKAPFL